MDGFTVSDASHGRLPALRPRGFRLRHIAIAASALVALAAIACTPTTQVTVAGSQEQTGIMVSGEGTVSVRPDIAKLALGVEASEPTVAAARERAATAMQAVQDALGRLGVAERDIRTQQFNIYPQYDYPRDGGTPRIVGFVVSNMVTVTVRDLDRTSEVLDSAVAAGGDSVRVNGISFTVENPEEFLSNAREEAVNVARQRAEVLARAAGVTLGTARSISESTSYYPPPYPEFARSAQAGDAVSTPINPGEQELKVFVSVVYNIAQ
jgi:uncharacterized protein